MSEQEQYEKMLQEVRDMRTEIRRMRDIVNSLVNIILEDVDDEYEEMPTPQDRMYTNPYDGDYYENWDNN